MPTGDLTGWHQIFADDFAQDVPLGSFPAAVSTKWRAYPCCWKDTSGNGTYWPEKGISIHDGVMDLWPHTETVNGTTYHISEAPQPILPLSTRGQLYGRYVIRFKADPVQGYKTAWLLWPDDGNRAEGELDFPEGNLTGNIYGFIHTNNGTAQAAFSTGVPEAGAWHTAVIDWSPNDVTYLLDGVKIGESTNGIPNTLMHYVIQTETQLSGGAPPDSASGHVLIDWVAVYALA
jgi:glycosyl hydrolase family 16